MRIYTASSEEALRARDLLKDWASLGFLSEAQHQQMQQETVCELRTTNIFLRLVLFLFTLVIVGAAAGLFFTVVLSKPASQATGVFFLILAAASYIAAEVVISQARLYRFGIEEALAVLSIGFLCAGIALAVFSGIPYSPAEHAAESLVLVAGAIFSLWIWHRFGLWYTFLAAMICVVFMPGFWTSSHSKQHLIVAAFYLVGLISIAALRAPHRLDYLDDGFSVVEALLWLGIYLAINLQLSSLDLLSRWWRGFPAATEFPRPFYWTTWALIWCLPPVALARGLHQRDRWVIAVGAVAAVLTLATNKPYLGWQRNSWDPMLLGALLTGVAILIRRWIARGPGGIRHGFTAERLSGKHKEWINVGTTAFSVASPQPAPAQTSSQDFQFGGGDSGGGGASSDF